MEVLLSILIGVGFVILVFLGLFVLSLPANLFNCAPNEVLIFTGRKRRIGPDRAVGYRIIKGGRGWRWPLIERVDRMDLTNMVIDVSATNAYSKGGIPLSVQGVANVKVAGHEPLLNNAIERFLGKSRQEIMAIAKATLEGALRGILATMTPEQVNEDKILFAERLVAEVEQDMTALGLVVDTLKIQAVTDEVKYLDSIGRKLSAEIVSKARIAEATARADSIVRASENLQKETKAQVDAQIAIAKAEAERRLRDIQTRRDALIAEELAAVAAAVAKAKADLEVQKARVEQVRNQLEADVVQPAKAAAEAMEAAAKAEIAPILEKGRARAEALRRVVQSLEEAGEHGRAMLLMQKLPSIIEALTDVIADTDIEKVTIIDLPASAGGDQGLPAKALVTLEQIKQLFGLDIVEKIKAMGPQADKADGARKPPSAVAFAQGAPSEERVEAASEASEKPAPSDAVPARAKQNPKKGKGPAHLDLGSPHGLPRFDVGQGS